jgi:S-adenosylmethionine:tRNA ribosyltransferase-isomerase
MQSTTLFGPSSLSLSDLDFEYPEGLVATEPVLTSRMMLVEQEGPRELESKADLLSLFRAGDCLVINDTRVLSRRVFSESGLEILFLGSDSSGLIWDVLCPSSRWKNGTEQILPDGVTLKLLARGRPQKVEASRPLPESYFEQFGDLPLPPYIQKARGERHNRGGDRTQYQTAWADKDGSLAAPTASLHFSKEDLEILCAKGVRVEHVTLHVGLGTFLPVTVENLDDHVMHAELAVVEPLVWDAIQSTRKSGGRVWALGTTVTRTLESAAHGKLNPDGQGGFQGETDLFIRPGFEFRVVDVLMTNFHQPRSTLLSLVAAFSDLTTVKRCYAWAIERQFRLFSYGDLSIWIK